MQIIDMNFSGVYKRRSRLADITIELADLPGTNAYCSEEAADVIRKELVLPRAVREEVTFPHAVREEHADVAHTRRQPLSAEGIHFLDSGNYHYATLFWLEKIGQPYQLVVFDHHTDMQPSAWGDDLISCGSWIRTALLRDENLKAVWVAGPQEEAYMEDMREKICLLTESDLSVPERAFAGLNRALPVYLSVDKDVLSKEAVDTNWDQGGLQTDVLLDCLRFLNRGFDVIGVDVCGEPDPNASDAEIKKSEEIDRKICQVLV